jgi:hypothetical protein
VITKKERTEELFLAPASIVTKIQIEFVDMHHFPVIVLRKLLPTSFGDIFLCSSNSLHHCFHPYEGILT